MPLSEADRRAKVLDLLELGAAVGLA